MKLPLSRPTSDRFTALADVAKTLGHPHRQALLEYIAQGERSVERLAELSGLSVANASQHLQLLRRAGCVQTRRNGKHVLYRLGSGPLPDVLAALHKFVEHQHAQIHQIITESRNQREHMDAVSIQELLGRAADDTVVLLDVRSHEEYAQGHLPGAVNIPIEQLVERVGELEKNVDIVAYCRGRYCVLSADAVTVLRTSGRQARPLAGGVPEWQDAGLALQADP